MGPSPGTSLGPLFCSSWARPSPPHPSPHLLHTCLAAVPSSAGPDPQTICYVILVQWRAVGGRSRPRRRWLRRGPRIKSLRHITAGHLLSTVADELWEILACTHSLRPRWVFFFSFFSTNARAVLGALMYEEFALEVLMCTMSQSSSSFLFHLVYI